MLLNLFLAILLDAFSEEDEEEREEEEGGGEKNKIEDLEGEELIEIIHTHVDYAGGKKKKKNAFVASGNNKANKDAVLLEESVDLENSIDEEKEKEKKK